MTRSVLIVSPHFPPINAADLQRVRMALPYFRQLGWEPTVLAVAPEYVQAPRDEWLLKTIPDDVEVHRVKALPVQLTKRVGLSTLATRCRRGLRVAGDQLLSSRKFDLVYFSTTQVGVHRLGLRWKQRYQVPFALDLQDPWVNDFYRKHPNVKPPGGRLKYAIAEFAARRDEPRCLREAAAVTTVSGRYIDDLAERYPWLNRELFTVLPFGAAERDFELARQFPVEQNHLRFDDGLEHWISVGRGGDDMRTALHGLFAGFRRALQLFPDRFSRVRLHFLGTDYAAGDRARETVKPIAIEEGVGDYVAEKPHRIAYSEALQCIIRADRLLVIGSDDAGYNPSKVAPYLLSGRPVFAILHQQSPAADVVEASGGQVIRYLGRSTQLVDDVFRAVQQPPLAHQYPPGNLAALTAESMTRTLTEVFQKARMY